jgi:predicted SAM-dependent methyltransferase
MLPYRKLCLGSGGRNIPFYINIDVDEHTTPFPPDLVEDCFTLPSFKENSIVTILASHILEHTDIKTAQNALQRWYDLLIIGGILRVCVPDIEKVCWEYIHGRYSLDELHGFFWGGGKSPYDFHRSGYDFHRLSNMLLDIGFKNVRVFDWRKTEHGYIDTYALAYKPDFDMGSGQLLSLNVECEK